MNNTKPYLLDRKCEGIAMQKDLQHFRAKELKELAQKYGLSSTGNKEILCDRIRTHLSTGSNSIKKIQTGTKVKLKIRAKSKNYNTLEEMLEDHKITNMRSLVQLSDDELEALINIIKLHEGKFDLKDLLKDVKNEDEKIKILVTELAAKLCRCIEKVGQSESGKKLEEFRRIAICISSIFHSKGITISRLQCNPIPMLIPKKGSSFAIRPKKK
jgi:hypothetical protein